jgi:hypothetical protein
MAACGTYWIAAAYSHSRSLMSSCRTSFFGRPHAPTPFGIGDRVLKVPLNAIAKQSLVVTLFPIGIGLTREVLRRTGIRPMAQGVTLWMIVSFLSAAAILYGLIS